MFVYEGHCLAIGVGIQVNNLFYYTTSIRVAQGAKNEIPQTRSIPAIITRVQISLLLAKGLLESRQAVAKLSEYIIRLCVFYRSNINIDSNSHASEQFLESFHSHQRGIVLEQFSNQNLFISRTEQFWKGNSHSRYKKEQF